MDDRAVAHSVGDDQHEPFLHGGAGRVQQGAHRKQQRDRRDDHDEGPGAPAVRRVLGAIGVAHECLGGGRRS